MADEKIVPPADADLQRGEGTQRPHRRGRRGTPKKLAEDDNWQFWHRLSLSLGIPVEELKDRMTAREKRSWERFRLLYGPFGPERQDWNTALIVSAVYMLTRTLIACHGGDVPDEPVSVEDCRLKFSMVTEKSPEEMIEDGQTQLQNLIARWKK